MNSLFTSYEMQSYTEISVISYSLHAHTDFYTMNNQHIFFIIIFLSEAINYIMVTFFYLMFFSLSFGKSCLE